MKSDATSGDGEPGYPDADALDDRPQVKVVFELDPANAAAYEYETMWAYDLGDGQYMLDNVPNMAYGVSVGDVFTCKRSERDERPYFSHVTRRSNNWTYRLIRSEGLTPEQLSRLDDLRARIREHATASSIDALNGWYAYSVLDTAGDEIEELVAAGESEGLWESEVSSGPDLGVEQRSVEDPYIPKSGGEGASEESKTDAYDDGDNAVDPDQRQFAVEHGFTAEKSLPSLAHLEGLKQRLLTIDGWAVVMVEAETRAQDLQERGELRLGGSAELREMIPNACHSNAADAYLSDPSLTPWVGYALSADGIWRHHGWLATARGTLIETTAARVKYFGIPLAGAYALEYAVMNLADSPRLRERVSAHRDFAAFVEMLRQRKADGAESSG